MAIEKKKKIAFLEIFEKNFGQISNSCRATGIVLQTYHNWMDHDPEFNSAIKTLIVSFREYVESKVKEKIDKGDDLWIWRWLKAYDGERWKEGERFQLQQNQLSMTGGLKLEVIRKTLNKVGQEVTAKIE
jgi:hypothetical protein